MHSWVAQRDPQKCKTNDAYTKEKGYGRLFWLCVMRVRENGLALRSRRACEGAKESPPTFGKARTSKGILRLGWRCVMPSPDHFGRKDLLPVEAQGGLSYLPPFRQISSMKHEEDLKFAE